MKIEIQGYVIVIDDAQSIDLDDAFVGQCST